MAHCTNPWLPLYQYIHKMHHEYNVTIALTAGYCHFLEAVIVNSVPIFIGLTLCAQLSPMHYSTAKAYAFFRLY